MELTGKRALVTGGSRGIGAAIVRDLAKHGADVAINCRTADDAAQAVAREVEGAGRKCAIVTGDVGREDEAVRIVDEAVAALGGLDILIHSAGGPSGGRIEDVSSEQWRETFAVHVDAAFHLVKQALPALRHAGEAAIILISSAAGIRGCPGIVTYCTVKGAILQFTRALARDLADDNIRVNCVAPGVIRTRFHDQMTPEQQQHNLANRIPLHREGTVDDVAEVVHLLMTNEFMTGETVVIDGGMTMQVVR